MSFCLRIIAVLLLGTITTLNAYTLEIIDPSPESVTSQSPFWCEENKSLYYCDQADSEVCSIMRYSQTDQILYCATVDVCPNVGFIRPVEGASDRFVVGCRKTVEEIQWDSLSTNATWIRTVFVAENCTEFESNVFQDGKADPRGRLFCGTRRGESCVNLENQTYANLFRVSAYERPVTLNEPMSVRVVNGMAWDENTNKYYSIDSCDMDIKSYDYCPYTGDISNEQIVYNYTDSGLQDYHILKGITCDNNGYLWVGLYGGGGVLQIDPSNGAVIQTVTLPCNQISGVSFAETNWTSLYVTTAAFSGFGPQADECGKVFRVTDLGAQGSALHKVRLNKY